MHATLRPVLLTHEYSPASSASRLLFLFFLPLFFLVLFWNARLQFSGSIQGWTLGSFFCVFTHGDGILPFHAMLCINACKGGAGRACNIIQLPLVCLGYPAIWLWRYVLSLEILVLDVRNHPEIDVSPASHIICILVNVVM